jgi:hypothetical protein
MYWKVTQITFTVFRLCDRFFGYVGYRRCIWVPWAEIRASRMFMVSLSGVHVALCAVCPELHNVLVQNQTTSDSLQQLLEMPRKSRWARLPFGLRMTVGTSAILVLVGGGVAGIVALTRDEPRVVTAMGRDSATAAAPEPPAAPGAPVREPAVRHKGLGDAVALDRGRTSDEADRSATRAPRTIGADGVASGQHAPPATMSDPKPPVTGAAAATTTTQTVDETRDIPYRTQLVRDPSLPRGTRRVQTDGIPGVETLRYLVTYAGGRETGRQLLDSTVTREPQDRVIGFGGRGGPGRGDSPRECGPVLGACLPLGRSACPSGEPVPESGSVQLDGSVQLGGSVTLLDDDPNGLSLDAGLVC